MLHYSMLIQWSSTDNTYIVTIPELPGCKAHGDTYEEASKHGRACLEQVLEGSKKLGLPLPEPRLYDERREDRSTLTTNMFNLPQNNSCSFCEKTFDQVQRFVLGPSSTNICNECIEASRELMEKGGYNFDDVCIELAKRSHRKEKLAEVQEYVSKMKGIRQQR
jgi:predicted RNase H-like HicB family nuclease